MRNFLFALVGAAVTLLLASTAEAQSLAASPGSQIVFADLQTGGGGPSWSVEPVRWHRHGRGFVRPYYGGYYGGYYPPPVTSYYYSPFYYGYPTPNYGYGYYGPPVYARPFYGYYRRPRVYIGLGF